MTWLLVEDDADIRTVVSMMMTFWGELPLAFPDGNAAWSWLDSVEEGTFAGTLPDLALMDIRMPGYRGDQIAARIRRTAPVKDIPIILMTAFSLTSDEIHDLVERSGIDHLVHKPLPDMDELRGLLYRVRDERRHKIIAADQAVEQAGEPEHAGQNGNEPTDSPPEKEN